MKVVCIGDSITYGQFLDRPELAWPQILAKRTGHKVINAGVCADTTRLALERFPKDVQERNPDAVVIQFGLNDCNRWETDGGLPRVSGEAFEANLHEMIDRCRALGLHRRIVLCTLTPTFNERLFEKDASHYSDIVRVVAYRRGTLLFDARRRFREVIGKAVIDKMHLNVAGHKLYATGIQACL